MFRTVALVIASSILMAACAGIGTVTTAAPQTQAEQSTSTTPTTGVTVDAAFGRATIIVGGDALTVAIADTKEKRAQGLMFVTDMGDVDGMLFVFNDAAMRSFWMRNTRLPLDIVYFDAAGSPVGDYLMTPCPDSSTECPGYPSDAGAMFALETVAGAYDLSGATLDVSSVP